MLFGRASMKLAGRGGICPRPGNLLKNATTRKSNKLREKNSEPKSDKINAEFLVKNFSLVTICTGNTGNTSPKLDDTKQWNNDYVLYDLMLRWSRGPKF